MALTDETLSLIAFKNLLGKSHTDNNKGLGNEAEGIFLNVSSNAVFMESIDSDPSTAISNGVAELVTGADLTVDPTSNGHAYFATYPTGHPLQGQRITNAISPTYGFQYEITVFDTGANQISVNDARDWVYQYNSGVFYQQDNVGDDPATADIYVYVGQTLDEVVFGTNGTSGSSNLLFGNGVTEINGTIGLGGTLFQNTIISANDGTARQFRVQDSSFIQFTTDSSNPLSASLSLLAGGIATLQSNSATGSANVSLTGDILNLTSSNPIGSSTVSLNNGVTSFLGDNISLNTTSLATIGNSSSSGLKYASITDYGLLTFSGSTYDDHIPSISLVKDYIGTSGFASSAWVMENFVDEVTNGIEFISGNTAGLGGALIQDTFITGDNGAHSFNLGFGGLAHMSDINMAANSFILIGINSSSGFPSGNLNITDDNTVLASDLTKGTTTLLGSEINLNTGGDILLSNSASDGAKYNNPSDYTNLDMNSSSFDDYIPSIGLVRDYIDSNTSTFTPDDKDLLALNTVGNNALASSSGISNTPTDGSYVAVFVNGQEYDVGNGVTTGSCYFSNDGGTSGRGFFSTHPNGKVQAGDLLYWNGIISGVNLENVWRLSFLYTI